MKPFIILAFIFAFSSPMFAQENFIKWNEGQSLQWPDFAGNVNEGSSFAAESFAEVKYNYTFNSPNDFYFDVYASFDKNTSWCRSQCKSPALLKHEQLHFDIAELYARKIKEAFYHFRYSKNFRNEIEQLFSQKKAEYHLVQMKYDDETNHSLNKQRQREWENFIANELDRTKPIYDYAKNVKK